MLLWQSSRAGLASLSAGLPLSKAASLAGERLKELAQHAPANLSAALGREVSSRTDLFLRGVERYRGHPYRRPPSDAPVLWVEGSTRLLDFGGAGAPVLVIPSLINRYHVLDLLPDRSFVRYLAGRGLRPLLVDWGEPGLDETGFTLTDYIAGRLEPAMAAARAKTGKPVAVLGYCMGGLLALALALRRSADTAALALLATPWDFHAERPEQSRLLAAVVAALPRLYGPMGALPVEVIQTLFWSLDPFLAERKFVRFAGLDPGGAEARTFVALEDWINDGVPLAWAVAQECARGWYGDNDPSAGRWRVGGHPVIPFDFDKPALVVVPRRDRIVPPASAAPLAQALADATVLRPAFGHIGMMAAGDARQTVWRPIADWLHQRLAA
jgi:polyhydroxyalkanoate synthase